MFKTNQNQTLLNEISEIPSKVLPTRLGRIPNHWQGNGMQQRLKKDQTHLLTFSNKQDW